MPRYNSVEALTQHREELVQKDLQEKVETSAVIVGMGTCGQAAGAGDVLQAIRKELENHDIQVSVRTVGCIGLCVSEPLVDIQLPGQPRVTYTNVKPSQARRLVSEHLVGGKVITEWAVGYVPEEW